MRTARASVIALAVIVLAWSAVAEAAPAPLPKPDRRMTSRQRTIAQIRHRLKDLGATDMRLERTLDRQWAFRCSIPFGNRGAPMQPQERLHAISRSSDEDGLEAMRAMLEFVERIQREGLDLG